MGVQWLSPSSGTLPPASSSPSCPFHSFLPFPPFPCPSLLPSFLPGPFPTFSFILLPSPPPCGSLSGEGGGAGGSVSRQGFFALKGRGRAFWRMRLEIEGLCVFLVYLPEDRFIKYVLKHFSYIPNFSALALWQKWL